MNWVQFGAVGVGGLLVGAIVNWLADQLPLLGSDQEDDSQAELQTGRYVAEPPPPSPGMTRPRCVHCGTDRPVSAYSGIVAWLLHKRACQKCGRLLSARHLIVEIILTLFGVYLWSQYSGSGQFVANSFYVTLFLLIGVIDLEYRYVLNIVMLPAFAIALIEILVLRTANLGRALAGYAAAQIIVMLIYVMGAVYIQLVNRSRKQPVTEVAFGMGDVTLATFCGLVVELTAVFHMLFLMIVIGALMSGGYYFYRKLIRRDYESNTAIAYGPAIVTATAIILLWPDKVFAMFPGSWR